MRRVEIVATQCRADERAVAAHQRRHFAEGIVADNVAVRRPDIGRHQLDAVGQSGFMSEHQHLAHEGRGKRVP
jgi:hypothetical protein